ncbi:MAG: diguanylate cyclase [Syntrophorhabdaceae bacterium]|nr:diguanylate cyclase [Syntrophorhabdaceae bacterium]
MSPEKRLFIIDDEVTLLAVLREFLQQFGLTVFAYETMPDLPKELRDKKPHAVLCDIVLPGISGIEILKEIKKIDRRIPVIMMTGYADEGERLESLSNGAYALLTKPFKSFEELFHIVNNSMDHYREVLRTEELTAQVEERFRREKVNILELEFLKSLHHMIGETEDPAFLLRNAYKLLKGFLDFEFFGTMLMGGQEADIHILPESERAPELQRFMVSVLAGWGNNESRTDSGGTASVLSELKTTNRLYGYAALYRPEPFNEEERSIFTRFCSHIALTLEKISLFAEIRTLSRHDGLTGVFNHGCIVGELATEIERSRRYEYPFSVLLLDVDDFKLVNDRYGHLAGDQVLKNISRIVKENLRSIDKVGRYGGEEFLVILPETSSEKAMVVAERLRRAIGDSFVEAENHQVYATVSGGLASYTPGRQYKELIKEADDNLYRAKEEGKNRIHYEHP